MAVDLLIEVYHAHLSNRCALDLFSQQLQRADIMPPNEFDAYWDGPNEPMPSKAKKGKASAKR
jgi:hypothetical protein